MVTVKLIGRTTYLRGKRLFDLLSRLKGFGVGRIVYRNVFYERYPEPSYYIITKVDPDMTDPTEAEIDSTCKSIAYGMKIWRGEQCGESIIKGCYKNDWRLVPRLTEAKFLSYSVSERPRTIVPDKIPMPPLLEHLVLEERRFSAAPSTSDESDRPMMRVKLRGDSRAMLESEAKLVLDS